MTAGAVAIVVVKAGEFVTSGFHGIELVKNEFLDQLPLRKAQPHDGHPMISTAPAM
jgi:hypothetical protein